MSGTTGNDTLVGTNAANSINGGGGSDSILGLGGNDTLNGDGAIPGPDGTDGNDTVRGGNGNDSIVGENGNDWLFGDAGNDLIRGDGDGNEGNDADTLDGGDGDDSIIGANGADSILGGAGSDSIRAGNGDNTVFGGLGADTIVGGTGNDILFGFDSTSGADTTDGADSIQGLGGNDTLAGGGGNDWLDGGTGDDFVTGGYGADTLIGGANGTGGDTVSYEFSPEAIAINLGTPGGHGGHAEGDSIVGFEAVVGSNFNDTLVGFDNFDNILIGGGGDDSIVTILGDTALGGDGNDTLIGSPESGSQSSDYLLGGDGNDWIEARGGTDTVGGGAGDDTVVAGGGDGNDSLDGGAGTDTLLLRNWTGPNINTDDIASGTYGGWTVSGPTGTDALRTFTYSDGTVLRVRDFEAIVCFAEGTLIATPRGEVPVEALQAGDAVLTMHDGPAIRPLVWTGRTSVDLARHPDPAKAAPVRITAGALGDGMPFRDLVVSPDHGILLDGHLVPAGLLVNGTTILSETWHRRVTYFHLEIEGHGLLVSEGALTESYLDDGNRHLFDNAAIAAIAVDFAALRGNGLYAAQACRPLLAVGDTLLAEIRARLAARAGVRTAALRRTA